MIKTASEDIHKRIRRARAVIAAGVRLGKPELEREGRADYAESVIENQVLLYGPDLTPEGRNRLVQAIFNTDSVQPTEALAEQPLVTPADIVSEEELAPVRDKYEYDIDNEVEDNED